MSSNWNWILGILIALCALFWLGPMFAAAHFEAKERKKRGEAKALYDERQHIARLRAGVHALYTLGGYLILWAALALTGRFAWTGATAELIFCGLALALCVWQADCTLHDAAVGWNQKKTAVNSQLSVYVTWGILTIIQSLTGLSDGNIKKCVVWAFLSACLWALLGITLYVRRRRAERQAEPEDDPL